MNINFQNCQELRGFAALSRCLSGTASSPRADQTPTQQHYQSEYQEESQAPHGQMAESFLAQLLQTWGSASNPSSASGGKTAQGSQAGTGPAEPRTVTAAPTSADVAAAESGLWTAAAAPTDADVAAESALTVSAAPKGADESSVNGFSINNPFLQNFQFSGPNLPQWQQQFNELVKTDPSAAYQYAFATPGAANQTRAALQAGGMDSGSGAHMLDIFTNGGAKGAQNWLAPLGITVANGGVKPWLNANPSFPGNQYLPQYLMYANSSNSSSLWASMALANPALAAQENQGS